MSIFKDDVLAGHVALITGGGTGICRGIAKAYLAHGAKVCITSRKQEVLDQTAKELVDETGGEVLAVSADVREIEQMNEVVAQTVARFGTLDTLVNGAAGNFLCPAAALSSKGFRTVIEIDLIGSFNATKAAFEHLCESKNGLVLSISATLHYVGTPLQIHASAAKAGIDAMTKNLAVEWGQFGIRSNAIAPGPIGDTEGMRRLAPADASDRVGKGIPMQRFGKIAEIADMAVYLRTTSAAYITGEIIVIDGGQWIANANLLG